MNPPPWRSNSSAIIAMSESLFSDSKHCSVSSVTQILSLIFCHNSCAEEYMVLDIHKNLIYNKDYVSKESKEL